MPDNSSAHLFTESLPVTQTPVCPIQPLQSANYTQTMASGVFSVARFVAARSMPVSGLRSSSTSAKVGTATYAAMGLYSIDAGGNGTLIASCASDVDLWADANTAYSRVVTQSGVHIAKGRAYYFGVIQVGATSASVLATQTIASGRSYAALDGRQIQMGFQTSQTALKTTFTPADLSTSTGNKIYGEVY